MNYYLSLGLAFWVVALLWRGRTMDWIIGFALMGLALSAHLMGFMWLVGTVVYVKLAKSKLAERISGGRWILLIAALLTILGIHFYIAHIYRTYDPVAWHVYYFLGFDQLVLYSHRYRALAMAVLLVTMLIALPEAICKGEAASSGAWCGPRWNFGPWQSSPLPCCGLALWFPSTRQVLLM